VNTEVPLPDLRVAMIVTKAPSEPWEIVKKTLEGCLNQGVNISYDVWVADEDASPETIAWCLENGVGVSCRKGVEGYHNQDWPRRTKCKEGNLMYFYDKHGYEKYDVVFQFDSDHVPTATYLANSLPAFANPDVCYIAMPNINNKGSWISDARQTQEAFYYGPSQMSYSYDVDGQFHMPMMTGSHYAVRTSALKEVGGIGPELDEDMNTTLMLASNGKKGVYAANAIAYGEGPASFEDAQKQEFQWARSAIISFIRWRRIIMPKNGKVKFGVVFRFVMIRTWYILQMCWFFYMWVIIAPIIFVNKWCMQGDCTLSFTNLLIHSVPIMFANWGFEVMIRKNDWLRPSGTPFFSLDLCVYRALRPVWNLIGISAGIIEMIFGKVPTFRVTPKGESKTQPLGVFTMWYFMIIPVYYAVFITLRLIWDNNVPIMLFMMYALITSTYTYIIFRHFQDQKFKAITWMNPIGHIFFILLFYSAFVACCIIFKDNIFTMTNAEIFIPKFEYAWQMWLSVGFNGLSLLWMTILMIFG